jgi:hypothetical protein
MSRAFALYAAHPVPVQAIGLFNSHQQCCGAVADMAQRLVIDWCIQHNHAYNVAMRRAFVQAIRARFNIEMSIEAREMLSMALDTRIIQTERIPSPYVLMPAHRLWASEVPVGPTGAQLIAEHMARCSSQ